MQSFLLSSLELCKLLTSTEGLHRKSDPALGLLNRISKAGGKKWSVTSLDSMLLVSS